MSKDYNEYKQTLMQRYQATYNVSVDDMQKFEALDIKGVHYAAGLGDSEALAFFIPQDGVNLVAKHGVTPLHWAAENGHDGAVKQLFMLGASVGGVKTNSGLTAHGVAVAKNHPEVATLLKSYELLEAMESKNAPAYQALLEAGATLPEDYQAILQSRHNARWVRPLSKMPEAHRATTLAVLAATNQSGSLADLAAGVMVDHVRKLQHENEELRAENEQLKQPKKREREESPEERQPAPESAQKRANVERLLEQRAQGGAARVPQ